MPHSSAPYHPQFQTSQSVFIFKNIFTPGDGFSQPISIFHLWVTLHFFHLDWFSLKHTFWLVYCAWHPGVNTWLHKWLCSILIGPGARLHPGVTSWSHGENAVLPRGGLARRARGVFGFWRAKLGPLCEPVKNLKNYFEVIFIASSWAYLSMNSWIPEWR